MDLVALYASSLFKVARPTFVHKTAKKLFYKRSSSLVH